MVMSNFPRKMLTYARTYPIALTIVVLYSKYPFGGAEDVINARNNLHADTRTDFWGAFSPWFFSLYKSNGWEILYSCFFSLLITFTFAVLIDLLPKFKNIAIGIFLLLALQYVIVSFAVSLSRDSALLTFIIFSIGAWILASQELHNRSNFWIFISIISMSLGMAFRPWLSVCLPFLLITLNHVFPLFKSIKKASVIFSLLVTLLFPILVDQSVHRILNLTYSFPQQQVMIMDLSSMACLSADRAPTEESLVALRSISMSRTLTKKELCSQYFPQNWASVIFYGAKKGENPVLVMVKAGDVNTYTALQSSWLNSILNQLPSYIQIKIMLGSQFFLAGESPRIEFRTMKSIFQLPFEITKALRLYSAFPVFLLLIIAAFKGKKEPRDPGFIYSITTFYSFFLAISIMAFIGDNQRYIFPGSVIVYLLTILRLGVRDDIKI